MKSDTPPRLATWVARTNDIRSTVAACSEPLGNVEPMSRGELSWLITIPPDGSLPFAGIAPTLIEWHTEDLRRAASGWKATLPGGPDPDPQRAKETVSQARRCVPPRSA